MKKIIATILALCMILGLAGVANAEATTLTMWTTASATWSKAAWLC